MKSSRIHSIFITIAFGIILMIPEIAFAQEKPQITRHKFKLGPIAGFQMMYPLYGNNQLENEIDGVEIDIQPSIGFRAGGLMNYTVTSRFSLQVELTYLQKSRKLSGGVDDKFKNNSTYRFIEIPVLCRVTYDFAGWSWYFNAGGNFSYWLSGKGSYYGFDMYDAGVLDDVNYSIIYGKEPNFNPERNIYVEKPNRIQLGIDAGVGFYFSIKEKQSINLDFRFTWGQSWMAQDGPIDLNLSDYKEELRHSFGTLSVNVAYVFDWDPTEGKKGKSNFKR